MGYKLKRIMMRPNGVEKQVRPSATPITTPGIYHNATLGLISLSSDGGTRLAIADKNLGATSTDVSSTDSYGNYYQRGNNYGFPNSGTVTKSSTAVNAGTYGPGNYYNSSTFITATPRDSSNNANLRGNTTNTNEARKGPCDTGFHIPSVNDAQNLIDTLYSIVGGKKQSEFETYLFMTKTQIRGSNGNITTPSYANFVLSKAYSNASPNVIRFGPSTNATVTSATSKSQAFPIRPFKNMSVQPREGGDWVKLYGLLSFNEIVELLQSNATAGYAELNAYAEAYYNKFYAEGKIDYNDTNPFLSTNGGPSGQVVDSNGFVVTYFIGSKTWGGF